VPSGLFPIVLAIHITLAVLLVVPSIALPFALRGRRRMPDATGGVVGGLMRLQSSGTVVIAAWLALTGAALLASLGPAAIGQPWLLVALAIYAANLVLALFVQRPNLRRLIGLRGTADDATWRARARRQRYVSYLMAALVGTIGFLMSSKPTLW
jgi:hypothetical protein